jgi:hypothetical protein
MHLGINTATIDISMQLNRMTVLVVFPDSERAAWYMDNCYQYYTRVLVVSMDGVYPYHHALKDSVERLWQDPDTSIFVFGDWCLADNPPAGTVFSLDKWAVEFCRRRSSPIHRAIAPLDWTEDPAQLARMIEVFANSKNNRNGVGVNMHTVKDTNYDWDRMPPTLRKLIE